MKLDYDRLNDTFGTWAMMDIAKACADRMADDCEDRDAELWDAMDDEIIYTQDQWAIIEYYSEPDDPMTLSHALGIFHNDVMNCLDLGDEDDD